jgi:hypothetical protein
MYIKIKKKKIEVFEQRHPPVQSPVDPDKKTIVVLGSGWASTSFLKDIDTDQYNVVKYIVYFCYQCR